MSSFILPASSLRSPAASLISPQACSPLPFSSSICPSPFICSLPVRSPTPCFTCPLPWSNMPSARSRVLLSVMAKNSFCLNRGKCASVPYQIAHKPCHSYQMSIYVVRDTESSAKAVKLAWHTDNRAVPLSAVTGRGCHSEPTGVQVRRNDTCHVSLHGGCRRVG